MNALNLFVNTSGNSLLQNTQNQSAVDPRSLPFFYGDTLTLNIYLYSFDPGANQSSFPFIGIPTPGLLVTAIIFDGTANGTYGALTPYAACVDFVGDPTGTFFSGTINLNTAGLQVLVGSLTGGNAWLGIGYSQAGATATCLKVPIIVGAGVQTGQIVPVPQLTALSLQEAQLLFFPIQPVAAQALYLATPTGKVIALVPTDDPQGGHVDINPTTATIPI